MKSMKKLFNFIYVITVIFTVIGGVGNLFYSHNPQFAIPLILIGVLLGLNYFGKINLPTKKGLFE